MKYKNELIVLGVCILLWLWLGGLLQEIWYGR